MVTPNNLLEAAKAPLFLQTSLKPIEVLLRCHTLKEFREKIARTGSKSIQYQCCPQTRNDCWFHFEKT